MTQTATRALTKDEAARDFSRTFERSMRDPVEIVGDGQSSAYLVSAELFEAMWSSYRRALSVGELGDDDMAALAASRVPLEFDWDLKDRDGESERTRKA